MNMPISGGCAPRVILTVLWLCAVTAGAAGASPDRALIEELNVYAAPQVWILEIPHSGPWSHWAMASPPRLVIDLANATSALARAPGLYAHDFSAGPVKTLRTSQFSNDPRQRVVRVTLVLADGARYESEQREGVVRIRIPAPIGQSWDTTLSLRIDGDGAREQVHPEPVRAEQTAVQPAPAETVPLAPQAPRTDTALQSASRLDSLLADTTFFEREPLLGPQSAWEMAAARLLEEGQELYVAGDTTGCLERFATCGRFYADTDAGRQAAMVHRLVLRKLGREVEAHLLEEVSETGGWSLLTDAMLGTLFDQAYREEDFPLAARILRVWEHARPQASRWAADALRLAQGYLEHQQIGLAGQWVARALEADPQLEISPRALFLGGAGAAAPAPPPPGPGPPPPRAARPAGRYPLSHRSVCGGHRPVRTAHRRRGAGSGAGMGPLPAWQLLDRPG